MKTGSVRALVVEDDRSWQQILSEILTDAGLSVDVVDSVDEAVACLRAIPHRLAVVDLALGNGDYDDQEGLRVLDAVRRHDPGCVAILLTGFATVELAVSALSEHGAYTCLRKEAFVRAEFQALVEQALASAPPMSREMPGADGFASEALSPTGGSGDGEESRCPGLGLVVEDDAGWRSILSEMLRDEGYQVRACSSYGEALGRLRRERYALAVVDLSLAAPALEGGAWGGGLVQEELDGYKLLAYTRDLRVPTIVVSGIVNAEGVERTYAEQGVFACLEKQAFDRQVFLRTVREAQVASRVGSELHCLTRREREVIELLARGLTNKEIAETLVITGNTVKRHLKAIFGKLEVHTRSAAAAKAISAGVPAEQPPTDGSDRS